MHIPSRLKERLRLTQGWVSEYLSKLTVQACEQRAQVGVAFESTPQLFVQLTGLQSLQEVEGMEFSDTCSPDRRQHALPVSPDLSHLSSPWYDH